MNTTSEHEGFIRYNISRLRKLKKRTASDKECVSHLERMVSRHGAAVLEPSERRFLARLKGETVPAALLRYGGHSHPLVSA